MTATDQTGGIGEAEARRWNTASMRDRRTRVRNGLESFAILGAIHSATLAAISYTNGSTLGVALHVISTLGAVAFVAAFRFQWREIDADEQETLR